MIDKHFDYTEAEKRLYAAWEKDGCFKPSGEEGAENYCIVIPPPNVTGSLHMGHALNNTLQDVLCRFERMRGKNVLWQVGTDHAGIATQMVVERQMMERQEPGRREIGREAFEKKVWDWKEESGGMITNQLRRLGASCDWSRERFTMDEGLSAAVRKVFVQLYKDGLIYRDKRLVNWDPKFLTAISDLEVEQIETNGKMWHFRYPLADGPVNGIGHITVATTRPETMLGDMCVAVHPDDERYQGMIGKMVRLPIVDREIPIVADEHADPEQGSGAVKITPAHDFNDFEVGVRAGIKPAEMINIFTVEAKIVEELDFIPAELRGLDRFDARKKVVAWFDENGLLEKTEDNLHTVPHGDRSGVVIEPFLTDQWYVDAETMAKPAIEAVETGKTKFVPATWDKTYYQWMRNIQPWCISRQLWWGHQIPVWYGPDGEVFCAENATEAEALAKAHYGKEQDLVQDEDVLDTWFSSALWPFSTLGWPDETSELKTFYPTTVLSTAFDIIFFWVARMMMMGLHFMDEVPFHTVYIHALVRDEKGAKMSKSKGNVIDPLEFMDKYGTDALRFTLTAMAAQGRDLKLAEARVEGYRNFGTKLWNAAKFTQMNECSYEASFDPAGVQSSLNKWIVHEASACAAEMTAAIEAYRFNDVAAAIYRFTWNIYCDWFLEFAKPVFNGGDEAAKAETRATAAWALDQILIMLHPVMPFVTEELWGALKKRDAYLMQASWPQDLPQNPAAAAEMNWAIDLITAIRSVRTEMNVPAGAKVPLAFMEDTSETPVRLKAHEELIRRLARIEAISTVSELPGGAVQIVHEASTFALPLAGVIDIGAELARLEKEAGKLDAEIAGIDKKLANKNFVEKAPADVVEAQRLQREEAMAKLAKLGEARQRLEDL